MTGGTVPGKKVICFKSVVAALRLLCFCIETVLLLKMFLECAKNLLVAADHVTVFS